MNMKNESKHIICVRLSNTEIEETGGVLYELTRDFIAKELRKITQDSKNYQQQLVIEIV
jgi:hypothetical protein